MIETPSLVDQYCHGVLRTELGLGTFEAHLARTEGPPAPGTTFFDTQTGFAVRRWCPPCSAWSRTVRPPAIWPADANSGSWSRAADCCAAVVSPRISSIRGYRVI